MKNDELVKNYFEEIAGEFDSIYDKQDSVLKQTINNIFRRGVHDRFDKTLKECAAGDKSVLNIGCGSGRLDLLLARKGLRVTGVDTSPEMIELAKKHLDNYENTSDISLNVKFVNADFIRDFHSEDKFDIAVSLGVLDYIKDPVPFLRKMKDITNEKIIVSYPGRYTMQTPIRKVWLYARKCPSYFYTKSMIASIYNAAGIDKYEIDKIAGSGGYLVKAYLSERENDS